MSEVSLSCDGREAPAAFLEKVDAAAAAGSPTVWLANHLFQRDPISLAAIVLGRNPRLRVGLMAVSPLTIHPVQAAMTAATLDEFYPGRITVCLGVGAPADLKSVDLDLARPLKIMQEAVEMTQALLRGESVTYSGTRFSIRDRRLVSGPRPVPVVLAASGPQMLELAGRIADGVLISAGTSIEFVKWSLDQVARGARGRAVRRHGLVYASIDDDIARANDRLRRTLAIVLRGPHHAANLEMAGSRLDQGALNVAVREQDWARAEQLITDRIVARHAASGRPADVNSRIAAYMGAGLDEVVIAGARDGEQVTRIMRAYPEE